MSKLLPCPFCGGQPSYKNACGDDWLQCDDCHCMTEMRSGTVNLPSIWNTRIPDAQHNQVIADLVGLLESIDKKVVFEYHGFDRSFNEEVEAALARAKALEVA